MIDKCAQVCCTTCMLTEQDKAWIMDALAPIKRELMRIDKRLDLLNKLIGQLETTAEQFRRDLQSSHPRDLAARE